MHDIDRIVNHINNLSDNECSQYIGNEKVSYYLKEYFEKNYGLSQNNSRNKNVEEKNVEEKKDYNILDLK